ncbi:hypothetical protein SmJEL517_g05958 [Synchytrium microbalum]|uniref:Uncharacterized protein n=1 Tax=Synchytrium microbalum TaxID=1806994 RepID=A0A507BSY7_9FUNG|nr:uncharacterized protein SmJEL517_g05958 [Synchytrium microbalum]TPX30488.1 hypothetical protein SmJEL517_g05958 [Synchytrium microbalum]
MFKHGFLNFSEASGRNAVSRPTAGSTASPPTSKKSSKRVHWNAPTEEPEVSTPPRIRRFRDNELAAKIQINRDDTNYLLSFSMPDASTEFLPPSQTKNGATHEMYINKTHNHLCWAVNFPPTKNPLERPERLAVEFSINRFGLSMERAALREKDSYFFELHAENDLLKLILNTIQSDDNAKRIFHHSSDAVRWQGILSIRVGGGKGNGMPQWETGVKMLTTMSERPMDMNTLGILADQVSMDALATDGESMDMQDFYDDDVVVPTSSSKKPMPTWINKVLDAPQVASPVEPAVVAPVVTEPAVPAAPAAPTVDAPVTTVPVTGAAITDVAPIVSQLPAEGFSTTAPIVSQSPAEAVSTTAPLVPEATPLVPTENTPIVPSSEAVESSAAPLSPKSTEVLLVVEPNLLVTASTTISSTEILPIVESTLLAASTVLSTRAPSLTITESANLPPLPKLEKQTTKQRGEEEVQMDSMVSQFVVFSTSSSNARRRSSDYYEMKKW